MLAIYLSTINTPPGLNQIAQIALLDMQPIKLKFGTYLKWKLTM